MFTGLIEDVGIMKKMVVSGDHGHIFVDTTIDTSSLKKGESIAVNGICLTVTDVSHGSFSADLSPETYKKTALRHAKPGSPLNLERSLRLTDRLGGHLVTGHIDGTGTVDQITKKEHFSEIVIMVDTSLEKYTVKKGSIAVDGISLTISDLVRGGISVSLIPFTYFHLVATRKALCTSG